VTGRAVAEGLAALIRRHFLFTLMLGAGIGIRVLFVVAYYPAFWFPDTLGYVYNAAKIQQNPIHGPLYPAFLHVISWTGGDVWIAVAQHALIIGLSCALYAVLVRRALPPWLAALACFPLVLGGQEIVLEHFMLSDTLFTVLTIASVLLMIGTERPRAAVYAAAGLLLGLAALDRTAALALAGVALVVALVRRVGWRPVAAFAVAAIVPIVANSVFLKPARWTDYDLRIDSTRYLYSRLAQFADCSKLVLTPQERTFCPPDPLNNRPDRGDHYLWSPWLQHRPASDNAVISDFNKQVLVHQWPQYLRLIASDTARFLVPGRTMGPGTACLSRVWYAPRSIHAAPESDACEPLLAQRTGFGSGERTDGTGAHPSMRVFLSLYSHHMNVPVVVNGLCLLLVVAALVRRRGSPLVAESALAAAVALSAIVVSMAIMYDPRYGIPVAVLFTVAGAMAAHALAGQVSRRADSSTSEQNRVPAPAVAAALKESE
jgi:hypothetical protein